MLFTPVKTCRCGRGCSNNDCIRDDWGYHDTDIERYRVDDESILQEKYISAGNAIQSAADALAAGGLDSAAIIKMGDAFHVMPDAESAFVYAAIDAATVSAIRAESGPKGPWWGS